MLYAKMDSLKLSQEPLGSIQPH